MQNENALISRICHDLIAPLNAINLGLEAFEMSRDESLLESVRESINKANSLMKFTRELFSEKSETFCYSAASLKAMAADFLRFHAIAFELKSDVESIAGITGKIVMYMAMISKEAMPFGGKVEITVDDSRAEITTKCEGRNMSVPEMGSIGEPNYKNIIRYGLMALLKKLGCEITARQEGAVIIFCKKK
jgi:hypothetical protein